jgi:hypothetical protein
MKVKIVKFDPNLSTLDAAGNIGYRVHHTLLNQKRLDDIIRKNAEPNAVEYMANETSSNQEYRLSNGQYLIISKRTGTGRIESVIGKLVRRF